MATDEQEAPTRERERVAQERKKTMAGRESVVLKEDDESERGRSV